MLDDHRAESAGIRRDDESTHSTRPLFEIGACPHDRDVGDAAVGDPHLGAVDDPVVTVALRDGPHARRVGAEVGLGQTEATDRLARGHLGQPFFALFVAAESADRVHRERSLHRHEATQTGVDGLHLQAGESVLGCGRSRAAVALEVHPEQAELAELTGEVSNREGAVLEPLADVGAQAFGAEVADGVDDRPLLVVDQSVEAEELSDRLGLTCPSRM